MVGTGVNSFAQPSEVGPLYPFAGGVEVPLVIVGVLLWIGWHLWKIRDEGEEYKQAARLYRRVGLERAMHHGGGGRIASEEEARVGEVRGALRGEHREEDTHETHDPREARDREATGPGS